VRGTTATPVGWGGGAPAGRRRKPPEFPDGCHWRRDRPAGKDRRKADPVRDVEDPMLSWCAQVGIDQSVRSPSCEKLTARLAAK